MENTGIGPVGRSWDVFGDGEVVFFKLPGRPPPAWWAHAFCMTENIGF